ncbi:helix-turn-helix domain-containing protein [Sphaerotilus sp.]|uniref:helix-turn-helix domain-containing protein n=1 Tax=Sphaerotilus sp. TaxID=2093942 RepID=UPI00286E7AB0|nr:helix-turn-helix domain-containing protein [Sphaerotilus sp.]
MDKRYHPLPVSEQMRLRRQAIEAVLAHPEWTLADAIRHLKTTMRLTSAELARLAGVSHRTVQDIEQGRSEGTVQTMNRLLGIVGLKLGVVRRVSGDQGGD